MRTKNVYMKTETVMERRKSWVYANIQENGGSIWQKLQWHLKAGMH